MEDYADFIFLQGLQPVCGICLKHELLFQGSSFFLKLFRWFFFMSGRKSEKKMHPFRFCFIFNTQKEFFSPETNSIAKIRDMKWHQTFQSNHLRLHTLSHWDTVISNPLEISHLRLVHYGQPRTHLPFLHFFFYINTYIFLVWLNSMIFSIPFIYLFWKNLGCANHLPFGESFFFLLIRTQPTIFFLNL